MGKKKRRKQTRTKGPRGGPAPAKVAPPSVRLAQSGPYRWSVARNGAMRTPGLIFADSEIIEAVRRDKGAQQVANVATLPGIVGPAIAMPDIHWGYGFPIGGVAAFDASEGVVSPGGIGYDINCGVRLLGTNLSAGDLGGRLIGLIDTLQRTVPAGLGSKRGSGKLRDKQLDKVLAQGAAAAVKLGYGERDDLERIEEGGRLREAEPAEVSPKARQRGAPQLGTLGSGNHFIEVQRVERVHDEEVARAFGLFKGQLVVMIHTGSRGLGHQVCSESVRQMGAASREAGIALPDRQLACAPLGSEAADRYLGAMASAANFAFANRQVIGHLVTQAIESFLGLAPREHGIRLVYDVAHNIAKWEQHEVEGRQRQLLVHRKGATRALGPHARGLPPDLAEVGQPVLVPGDMGRASYVLVGTERAARESFSSSCHGAGRRLSRSEALRTAKGRQIALELSEKGIVARAESRRTLVEEMPEAYKNVDDVVSVICGAGICRPVARLVPLGVVKG